MFSAGFGGYSQVFLVAFPPVLLPHRFVTSATFPGSWHLSLGFLFYKGLRAKGNSIINERQVGKIFLL